ncbi:MAG: noncanonical pyrimidine nucleotidase, YjjG family [Spirochaetales bacterium]|nr:noncanonical pyrimidine nucleotidase, YjjG family [Spirochaetales bacterium]
MKNYQVLIFDADETLFDYRRGEAYALELALTEAGIPYQAPYHIDLYSEVNGRLWKEYERGEIDRDTLRVERFRRLLSKLNAKDKDGAEIGVRYLEHLGQAGFMLEGAMDLIEKLNSSYTLALLTNGFSAVQRSRIAKTKTERFFDTIIISEEVGWQKPQAEIFDLVLKNLNHQEKADVLMIGDSLSSDIRGGINAGIDTCWYNPQKNPVPLGTTPTYVVHTIGEMFTLLKK